MTSIAKLKDRARKHEQNEDWKAAIEVYRRVLEAEEGEDELELELGLYNRIGDLFLRIGQTDQAVSYYERAADKYAEYGFLNNAIALCNKALRHRPERPDLYLKLSRLCTEQGFFTDARRWILGYAERQVKTGKVDEALSALAEFANRSDDPDVRELLARQLASRDRNDEAVDQLRRAHAALLQAGDPAGAERVAGRVRELDPAAELNLELDDVPEFGAPGWAGEAGQEGGVGEGLAGLEPTSVAGRGRTGPSSGLDSLGGLETFEVEEADEPESLETDPAGAPAPGHGEAVEEPDDEEPEPLPMLDTGYDEDEEEPEPLPLLDGGHDERADDGELAPEPEEDDALDAGDVDLDDLVTAETEESADDDLGGAAIVGRARVLVDRGRLDDALRELGMLSDSHAAPDVFRAGLAVVQDIVHHDANHLPALQRRVELAARVGERSLLVDAYVGLADSLARLGAETKAQAMYQRVLDLDPENEAAREALGIEPEEEPEEEAESLGTVLEEIEIDDEDFEADSDPAFVAMLSQFKAKVTEQVKAGEAGDHYDLGLAFKEMGLLDEAIGEFQTALTAGEERLKVYEELGQCFMLKDQLNVALKVLARALQVPHRDDTELIGVYYLLGKCHEELGHRSDAREAYERVLSIDDGFADVPERVARL